jgi:hypothetical protein
MDYENLEALSHCLNVLKLSRVLCKLEKETQEHVLFMCPSQMRDMVFSTLVIAQLHNPARHMNMIDWVKLILHPI